MIRIVVCGGRDYADVWAVNETLTRIHVERGIAVIIQGGAPGADEIARIWADEHGVIVETFAADWDRYGKAAGPIRSGEMLTKGNPDGVVAFPGGRGTANCIKQAEALGLTVWRRHW